MGSGPKESQPPATQAPAQKPAIHAADSLIDCAGIDWNEVEQLRMMNDAFPPHKEQAHAALDKLGAERSSSIGDPDLYVLYGMIAHFSPTRIMEAGCGDTTIVAREALSAGNLPAELIGISHNAKQQVVRACDAHLDQPIREVPLDDFKMLRDNEMLLINTNHIYEPGNDVAYLYQHVLPALHSGVIVGIQGVRLPREYTREELQRGFNEQALLQMFLTNNSRAQILFAGNWLTENHEQDLLIASAGMSLSHPLSFWMRLK